MASDEETTKTKVVDFEELYNFIVDNFFIWNHLSKKNYVWISHIEIQNFQTTSDGETTKPKVVLLDDIYNSWNPFHLNSFRDPNTHFKIW